VTLRLTVRQLEPTDYGDYQCVGGNQLGRTHKTITLYGTSHVEVCMGMGKTGIPWVPWDSHGNGNKISHGMGMGWEWE